MIATESMGANPWDATFTSFDEDQKIAYSNDERISYGGLFTQLEYVNDNFSAFFQAFSCSTVVFVPFNCDFFFINYYNLLYPYLIKVIILLKYIKNCQRNLAYSIDYIPIS